MTDERVSTPPSWTEADYDSDRPDVRQAKQPAVFEHESGELAVYVRPADPGESTAWRVEVGEGGRENLTDADAVNVGLDDRATALEQARSVMEQIDSEGVPPSPEDADWKARLR
jgi:hypothetical protein